MLCDAPGCSSNSDPQKVSGGGEAVDSYLIAFWGPPTCVTVTGGPIDHRRGRRRRKATATPGSDGQLATLSVLVNRERNEDG
jgi:hypothetical protein